MTIRNPQQIRDKVLARMLHKEFTPKPECPFCYSLNLSYETVDVGVGRVQVGPEECGDCGSIQMHPSVCAYCLPHTESMFSATPICYPVGVYPDEFASWWFDGKYRPEREYLNSLGFDWMACARKYPEMLSEYGLLRDQFYAEASKSK